MAFNKIEYNRARRKEEYDEFKQQRTKAMELLGGKCVNCNKIAQKGFHFHHIEYIEDYPTHSKSMSVRWKRLKEALAHPERFALLCPHCHNNAIHGGSIQLPYAKAIVKEYEIIMPDGQKSIMILSNMRKDIWLKPYCSIIKQSGFKRFVVETDSGIMQCSLIA